jgi:predicted Rossmann fold nucleotide-binding protein DprA/Smf involved in DNA uptake
MMYGLISLEDYPIRLLSYLGKGISSSLRYYGDIQLFLGSSDLYFGLLGCRDCSERGLTFTGRLCAKLYGEDGNRILVSGYARGIDLWGWRCWRELGGKGVMFLPHGLNYLNLTEEDKFCVHSGRLLFLSLCEDYVPFSSYLAISRNHWIYGLSDKVYIAESKHYGGTYRGVIDGLRKKKAIYVRKGYEYEPCYNNRLIDMGCYALDEHGNVCASSVGYPLTLFNEL